MLAGLDGRLPDAVRVEVEAVDHPLVRVCGVGEGGQDDGERRDPPGTGRHDQRDMVDELAGPQLHGVDPAGEIRRQLQAQGRAPARVVEVVVVEVHGPVLLGRDGEVRRRADPPRPGHRPVRAVDQPRVARGRAAVGHAVPGDAVPEVPPGQAAQLVPARGRREDLRCLQLAVVVLADAEPAHATRTRARRHHDRAGEAAVQGVEPALHALLLAEPARGGEPVRPAQREAHRALHGVELSGEPAPDPRPGGLGKRDADPGPDLQLEAPRAGERELEPGAARVVVAAQQHLAAAVAHERGLGPEPQPHPRGACQARHRRRLRERPGVRGLQPARERGAGEPRPDLRHLEARSRRVAVAVQQPHDPVVPGRRGGAHHELHRLAGVRHERVGVADELGPVGATHAAGA